MQGYGCVVPEDTHADGPVELAVEAVPGALVLGGSPFAHGGVDRAAGAGEAPEGSLRSGLVDAGPLAVAGFVTNAASVIVTVLVARLLSTRGYGSLAQLTSLFLIISLPGNAVIVGVVRRATAWRSAGSGAVVWGWARRIHALSTLVVVVFALAVLGVRSPLSHHLSIGSPIGVFAVLVAGVVWILLCFDRGLLQAHRDYRALSINLVVEGAVRTAGVLSLVAAGLGVAGAAWGIFLAEVSAAVHARIVADRAWSAEGARGATARGALRRWLPRRLDPAEEEEAAATRRTMLFDLLAALAAMGLLAWLQNIDVIVLGREAPHHSGSYAAISVTSKALVFAAFVVGAYLLPEAALEWRRGHHALRQLGVALLVLAVPIVVLLVAAVAFPHLLLSTVFSSRYLGAQSALALLVVAMICLSTTILLTMYLLAAAKRWVAGLLLVGAIAAVLAIAAAHGAPRATAGADLVVQALLLVAVGASFAWVHRGRTRPGRTLQAGLLAGGGGREGGVSGPSAAALAPGGNTVAQPGPGSASSEAPRTRG